MYSLLAPGESNCVVRVDSRTGPRYQKIREQTLAPQRLSETPWPRGRGVSLFTPCVATGYEYCSDGSLPTETHGRHATAAMSTAGAPRLAESLSVSAKTMGSGYGEVGRAQFARRGMVRRGGFGGRFSGGKVKWAFSSVPALIAAPRGFNQAAPVLEKLLVLDDNTFRRPQEQDLYAQV